MNNLKIEKVIFIVLESKQDSSESYYLEYLYRSLSWLNKKKLSEIFDLPIKDIWKIKNCASIENINKKIDRKIDNSTILENNTKNEDMVIYIFIDNDTEYSKKIINNWKNGIKNNLKQKLKIGNDKIFLLHPKENFSFEEFIYYHFPINNSYNGKKSIEFIKQKINNENIKGQNIINIFKFCFKNQNIARETLKLLERNLKKYNSKYINLLAIFNVKK